MIVYKITNIVNNKCYIGKTTRDDKRLKEHLSRLKNNKHYNEYLQRSFNQHHEENFIFEIIDTAIMEEELNDKEIYWIDKYNSANPLYGYNLTYGGDGCKHNEITCAKLSEINKGKTYSEEYKQKMSVVLKGRIFTPEWKQKISDAKKNVSQETREKLSKANTGKKHTEESKQKMSRARMGVSSPRKGTVGLVKAWNKGKCKKIEQYDLQGNYIKCFDKMEDVIAETTFPRSSVTQCCNGRAKTANGFIWKYKEESIELIENLKEE